MSGRVSSKGALPEKSRRYFRIPVIIQMGKSGKHGVGTVDAVPGTAALRLYCGKSFPAFVRIKIVKFMSRDLAKIIGTEYFLPLTEPYITESGQSGRAVCPSRYHAGHPVKFSVHTFHLFMEVHETSAFRHAGHPVQDPVPDLTPHGFILFQYASVQLRISAVQQKAVQIFRKTRVMHGGEKYQLRSHFPEKAEVIFIKKAEGFIPRHSDAHRFFQPETF